MACALVFAKKTELSQRSITALSASEHHRPEKQSCFAFYLLSVKLRVFGAGFCWEFFLFFFSFRGYIILVAFQDIAEEAPSPLLPPRPPISL